MNVKELVNELELKVLSGEKGLDAEISGGYVSDLLSDVMGNAEAGQVWITLQTHKNVMAIASLKDLAAVILVSGNTPDNDMAMQSNEEGIPVLGTSGSCFQTAGLVYECLKRYAEI